MSVVVVGLSHKTAPVAVRERFALSGDDFHRVAADLAERPGVDEACVVSTCNRVEFVVRAPEESTAHVAVRDLLDASPQGPFEEAEPYLYRYADREAIRHVFRVASSLDSMVVGEPQIL